jgi:ketosteroid isomerase-like protein
MYEFNSKNLDHLSIKSWFLKWEKHVQNKQYSLAKKLFENDVVSFGTWMDVVQGLDQLKLNQWENIWPTINEFKFLTSTLFIQLSQDKLFANSILIWDSVGYNQDNTSFKRSGRATVTLKRDNFNSNWKGIHTHFSLNRGIPQQSFGNFR